MELRQVALLAQPWGSLRQQTIVAGAVRLVAGQAILPGGRMLPQERPAFIRVALVTGLIDRVAHECGFTTAAVWVVAVGATHRPAQNRV